MKKHAILIMAHEDFDVLEKSLQLHDHAGNDLYVHIDKKVRDFDFPFFSSLVKHSSLTFVERTSVTWGAYSQINAELVLLKAAMRGEYAYFHLLSGSDLPIKPQEEMHAFFDAQPGAEYLREDTNAYRSKDFMVRIRFYHFFQETLGKKRSGLLNLINLASLKTQEVLGVDRTRHSGLDYRKGLNWFSITPWFAAFLLALENEIRRDYRYSLAADEVFIYTLAWNSKFVEKVSDVQTRMTRWVEGKPYVFRASDFDTLNQSKALWARKFSTRVDADIVQRIYDHLHS